MSKVVAWHIHSCATTSHGCCTADLLLSIYCTIGHISLYFSYPIMFILSTSRKLTFLLLAYLSQLHRAFISQFGVLFNALSHSYCSVRCSKEVYSVHHFACIICDTSAHMHLLRLLLLCCMIQLRSVLCMIADLCQFCITIFCRAHGI